MEWCVGEATYMESWVDNYSRTTDPRKVFTRTTTIVRPSAKFSISEWYDEGSIIWDLYDCALGFYEAVVSQVNSRPPPSKERDCGGDGSADSTVATRVIEHLVIYPCLMFGTNLMSTTEGEKIIWNRSEWPPVVHWPQDCLISIFNWRIY